MIYLISPYRNRVKQLQLFLEHYSSILELEKVKIVIIEQFNNKAFNKGLLLNCGIKELNKRYNFTDNDFLIFNDIDCLVKPHKLIDFLENPDNKINHIYGFKNIFFDKFNCLGGIVSMKYSTFCKINGFPNNFWGWGGEDLALGWRAKHNNIFIDCSKTIGINDETDIIHFDNPSNETSNLNKKLSNTRNLGKLKLETHKTNLLWTNGINNCIYNFKFLKEQPNYLHLFLDIYF